ncbi:phage antirepressor KilAC domain-containing protein [Bacillus cytotoxicus]|uniref:phage antirepressor KilAC domain-containing protein n=1 Tax=Bacillus cytotoxicus TaxID=580165 RepID=UPI002ABAA964|nr:phage antirepressor KilAC domain-containing protein [Bacillus cytotoxicus]
MSDQLTVANELHILGKQHIAGYEFTGIEGGFGEGKKAMLVKEVAEIHDQPLGEVNRRINDNRSRFKNGIDIVDLKNDGFEPSLLYSLGFTNRDIAISKSIYLLSERGYAKLLKILEDDTAWELYDQFVDGYFNMRKQLSSKQFKIPTTFAEALRLAADLSEQNEKLEVENKVLKPKGEYFDALVERKLLTNFRDTAKEFKMKQNEFIDWLLAQGYVYRDAKGKLKPYMQYVPQLFEIKEWTKGKQSGTQTLISPRGRETFRLMLQQRKAV